MLGLRCLRTVAPKNPKDNTSGEKPPAPSDPPASQAEEPHGAAKQSAEPAESSSDSGGKPPAPAPAPAPTPAPETPNPAPGKGKKEPFNLKGGFRSALDLDLGWFHTFSGWPSGVLSGKGLLHTWFQRFLFKKLRDMNPDVQEADILEGAKEVYKILFAIMFKEQDISRLDDAMDPEAMAALLTSVNRARRGPTPLRGELHEIKDARVFTFKTRFDRPNKQFYLLVGVELLTVETLESVVDGLRHVEYDKSLQRAILFFETPLCVMDEDREEIVASDLAWKLVVGE